MGHPTRNRPKTVDQHKVLGFPKHTTKITFRKKLTKNESYLQKIRVSKRSNSEEMRQLLGLTVALQRANRVIYNRSGFVEFAADGGGIVMTELKGGSDTHGKLCHV